MHRVHNRGSYHHQLFLNQGVEYEELGVYAVVIMDYHEIDFVESASMLTVESSTRIKTNTTSRTNDSTIIHC